MKNRPDTTKRRKSDMTPHYKPYSAGHAGEPGGTVMRTCIKEEPQSLNTRGSAMPGRKFLFC